MYLLFILHLPVGRKVETFISKFMTRIYIRSTFKTPNVNFDPEKGLLEMKGKSIPEHAKAFYSHLIDWIKEYSKNPQAITTVNLQLEYVNTDTKKYLLEIVELFGKLQKNGKEYEGKIIQPAIRSALRDVIAKYIPEEINTTKRNVVVEEIKEQISMVFAENYLSLENVLIRNIQLPEMLMEAINRKLKQEQAALEYEYKIQKEVKEAERKRIEAEGIEAFQRIVTRSINDKLLRWKGIEATLELAQSPNAKVVVVGGGKDGLPLILGGN